MKNYKLTYLSCYLGYFTQAIVVNLCPVFFIIFQNDYNISYAQLANLIFVCFFAQVLVDVLSIKLCDILTYRKAALLADGCAALGLILLGILPSVMNPVAGIFIATVISSVGSGFMEVIISPIVDAIPKQGENGSMNLLHSFYCWGQVGTVLISTVVLRIIGSSRWRFIPIFWALIPLTNIVMFLKAQMPPQLKNEDRSPVKQLFTDYRFILLMLIMICSGAAETAVSQWASLFAQRSLGVDKTLGDLLGPCLFAIAMGAGRTVNGILGSKIDLEKALILASSGCILSYLALTLVPIPAVGLAACSFVGLSVAVMWPGTLTIASPLFPNGGIRMFSILAVCGDIGCITGPWIAGQISDLVVRTELGDRLSQLTSLSVDQVGLRAGLLVAIIFPVLQLIAILILQKKKVHADAGH